MGPFRVCEITPQGTIRVETLDGIETVGFLNGSKFKRYYDPLTIETIQVARDKQAAKERELKRIQDAIKEGKEREAKNKARRQANVWTYDVFTCESGDDTYPPPIRTQIEVSGPTGKVLYNALIDTGASHNLISFDAWNQLGRPALTLSNIKVKGVNGQTSYVIGILHTTVHYANGHMEGSFWVMPAGELSENVLLGRTWTIATRCQFDWETNSVTMVIPTCPTATLCTHCAPIPRQATTTPMALAPSSPPHQLTTNPTNTTIALYTPNNQKTKNKARVTKQNANWGWIPKKQSTPIMKLKQVHVRPTHPCYLWVSKALLKAQGFYEGNRSIWIPKEKSQSRPQALKLTSIINTNIKSTWRAKDQPRTTYSQQQTLSPTSSATNKSKDPITFPTSSPLTSPTSNIQGSREIILEVGESSTTLSCSNNNDMVLIFPPRSPNLLEPIVVETRSPSSPPSPTSSARVLQLSHATELLKRHIKKPRWWWNRFSQPQSTEANPQGSSMAHHHDNPISVFIAEAEPEEDFLQAFQHWIPYEEERAEYESMFFQQYWHQLPRDIRTKVKVLVFRAHYHQRFPFGVINAPSTFQRALANVLISIPR